MQDARHGDQYLGVEPVLQAVPLLVIPRAVREVGLDEGQEAISDVLRRAQRALDEGQETCTEMER